MKKTAVLIVLAAMLAALAATACAEPKNCPYSLQETSILYRSLPYAQRRLFDRLYDAIRNQDEVVPLSNITADEANNLLDVFFNECPELCGFKGWVLWGYDQNGVWKPSEVHLEYKRSKAEQERFIREIAALSRRFSSIHEIYAYLCVRFTYGDVSKHPEHMYAYDALKSGKAVCNGYAQTLAMLCHFAHIECSYISGDMREGGGHAWNITSFEGRYTLLDCTWDDAGSKPAYRWFGLSDGEMARSRIPNKDKYKTLPAAVNLQGSLPIAAQRTPAFDYAGLSFTLRQGDSGSAVSRVNRRLIDLGFLSGSASSRYDQRTAQAVAMFQRANGIHGESGTMGICTKLTQAALFSAAARRKNDDAVKPASTIIRDPVSFYIGTNYGVRINGSRGSLTFTMRNNHATQPITAFVVRYWADDANGKLVCPANELVLTAVGLEPGSAREMTVELARNSALSRAAVLKWNVTEVAYANGEVFLKEDLSGDNAYCILTYNEKVR